MGQRVDFRCPACGARHQEAALGIHDGEFAVTSYRPHTLEALVYTYGGKASISVEKRALTVGEALAMYQMLTEARRHVGEQLEEAVGRPLDEILSL